MKIMILHWISLNVDKLGFDAQSIWILSLFYRYFSLGGHWLLGLLDIFRNDRDPTSHVGLLHEFMLKEVEIWLSNRHRLYFAIEIFRGLS